MLDLKDLMPAFLRLLPEFHNVFDQLPMKRHLLQAEVRAMVKKYGPAMGDLYYVKDLALEQYIQKSLSSAELVSLSSNEARYDEDVERKKDQ